MPKISSKLLESALLCSGLLLFTGSPILIATSAATFDNAVMDSPNVRVVERGQDFTAYEVKEVGRNERGEEVTSSSRFTLLENGLNYLETGSMFPVRM